MNMKRVAIVFAAVIVVLLGALIFVPPAKSPTVPQAASSTSTIVGSGTAGNAGTVRGTVVLGPTCPVERIPPDPACAPRPYQTSIAILRSRGSGPLATIQTDSSGAFSVSLAAGIYVFHPQGGAVYPRCTDQIATVAPGKTTNVTISCDTGIR